MPPKADGPGARRPATLVVETGGERLDRFLASQFSGYSRAFFKDLIQRGLAQVDGTVRAPDFRLSIGQVVSLRFGEADWSDMPFRKWVAYEDEALLILRKPAGIVTHPIGESWIRRPDAALAEKEPSIAGLLALNRPGIVESGAERCGIVHRLDRQTSGILAVAKTPEAQASLLEDFRERRVHKTYRAIVLGELDVSKVDAPIGRLPGRRRIQVTPWGKEASTEFKTLRKARGLSLVQARPITGRTHQIRVHLALAKHPVMGDPEWFRKPELACLAKLGLKPPPRMMLHAYRLRLTHPATGEDVSFAAQPPADFRGYWEEVGKKAKKR